MNEFEGQKLLNDPGIVKNVNNYLVSSSGMVK